MTQTQTLQAAAADALLGLLPTNTPLYAVRQDEGGPLPGQVASAVVGSFVGGLSADVALVVADQAALAAAAGTDSPLVSAADLLRPALEAATSVLGAGVLGEAHVANAAALFSDPEAAVFKLTGGDGEAGGWFAIRLRENPAGNGVDESVLAKLGRINNVEMALTVEIGRTRMSVRDVLNLEPGGVIELDRSAGAPADVLLNGRLIAHGEVVVVDQDYAVRITKILDVPEGLL
ncbi:flagellar motor switch protein FliN [Arthrobacter sp.]|uniref:flagellar motor switch protein FliN n=1 Tax=Arthrobacter sp. TaxID=1667 RepID=UPI003398B39F